MRTHLAHGSFYADAQMSTGRHTKRVFNNLMAFWPGMQVMMGDFESASSTLNAFHAVRRVHEFTPEDFSFTKWKVLNGRATQRYPLRPELIESTWYMYEATGDRSWLLAAREMFESLSTLKVRSVSSVVWSVTLCLFVREHVSIPYYDTNRICYWKHRYDAEWPVWAQS